MDHLPNVKPIHVRWFMKSAEASGIHRPSMSFSVTSYSKSVQGHRSTPASSSVLPEALKNQASILPKSLPVSKMLQLGKVVTNVQKSSEYQSDFIQLMRYEGRGKVLSHPSRPIRIALLMATVF